MLVLSILPILLETITIVKVLRGRLEKCTVTFYKTAWPFFLPFRMKLAFSWVSRLLEWWTKWPFNDSKWYIFAIG